MDAPGDGETSMRGCRECGSLLAHDQRYCLECGARRGSLPPFVVQAIGRAHEQGVPVVLGQAAAAPHAPGGPPAGEAGYERDGRSFDAWIGAPRAAAAAVLGMLGFGVVVGSLVGESAASGTSPIIVAVSPHHGAGAQNSQGLAGGAGSAAGGSGGGGGGVRTITVGSPAAASPAAAAAANTPASMPTTTTTATGPLPPIKHVFLIALSTQGYNQTFGHTNDDPYLAVTLAQQGEVLVNYYAVAGGPLANEIAMMSGQGPTPDTVNDCPRYRNVVPGNRGARGQVLGNGCVYPKATRTLAGELTAAKLDWKSYVQLSTTGKKAQAEACNHPKLGSAAPSPTARNPYASSRDPFLYFDSLNTQKDCAQHYAPLTQLTTDLKSASTTPALSYVIPDVCHDGADSACAPNGMVAADAFLKSVVPQIKRSAAYKADGLIAITFDQAPQTGPTADPSSCCDNPKYPNLQGSSGSSGTSTSSTSTGTNTGTTTTTTSTSTTGTTTTTTSTTSTSSSGSLGLGSGASNPTGGGGQVGLLLLSRYIQPGINDVTDYFNHFSLLASIESLFGLKRLAYAGDPLLPLFGNGVYTNYTPG